MPRHSGDVGKLALLNKAMKLERDQDAHTHNSFTIKVSVSLTFFSANHNRFSNAGAIS